MATRAQAEAVILQVTEYLKEAAQSEDPSAKYEETVQTVLDKLNEVV